MRFEDLAYLVGQYWAEQRGKWRVFALDENGKELIAETLVLDEESHTIIIKVIQ
jgi:hypothetical protein